MRRVSLSLLACVGLIAVAACSKPEAPPPEAPQTTAGMTGGQGSAGDTFGILRSIHEGEVELSTLAQQKATDPRVRAYADNVAKDHKARMAKDNQLMSGLGVSATDSDTSGQIKAAADREKSNLDSMSGVAFDRAYLDDQISYYRLVLDTFDKDLLPNVKDPQIRVSLQNGRARANDHLREAQDLRNSLSTPN